MTGKSEDIRPICQNRKARHEYEVLDTIEAGLVLVGSEVKSCRGGRANIAEAFVRFRDGEAWLMEAHISPYEQAGRDNHEPKRPRKLLLKDAELARWAKRANERGLAVIPLRMYFKGPWVKVELALGKGRKLHDKRDAIRDKDDQREMQRAARRG